MLPSFGSRFCLSVLLLGLAAASGGCETLFFRGVNEARGGRGAILPIAAMPESPVLDKFNSVRVEPVLASADGGNIPQVMSNELQARITRDITDSGLFAGTPPAQPPILVIRVRLTTYWIEDGTLDVVLGPFSEVLGRLEFVDGSDNRVLGSYQIRGFSKAVERNSPADLAEGFSLRVLDLLKAHRKRR